MSNKWKKKISVLIMGILLVGNVGCSVKNEEIKDKETTSVETRSNEKTSVVEEEVQEEGIIPDYINPEEVEGDITLAYGWVFEEDMDKVLAEFKKVYPKVNVTWETLTWPITDFLATKAAAASENLPDVVVGFGTVPVFATQGWMYPLTDLVARDPEFNNVRKELLEEVTLGDELYAIPYAIEFLSFVLNLDLIDELNLDIPEYNWSVEEFVELIKEGTTNETSGINSLALADMLTGVFGGKDGIGSHGYNPETKYVDLTSGAWVKSYELLDSITNIKGAVADSLINQEKRDKGEADDYEKKFGKDVDVMEANKVVVGTYNTWDRAWIKDLSANWDYYPLPREDKEMGYQCTTLNFGFLSSTCEDVDAGYELLKYLTYGTQGNKDRLNILSESVYEEGEMQGELKKTFYIPITTQEEVVEQFKNIEYIPEGIKWMYENLATGEYTIFRHSNRDVPNWESIKAKYLSDAHNKILKGEVEAQSVAAEVEEKVNKELQEQWEILEEQIKVVEEEFVELRKEIDNKK